MNILFVLILICWYLLLIRYCDGFVYWHRFATSPSYANRRLVTNNSEYFDPLYYPKDLPLVQARMDCSRECASNDTCLAFNFYDDAQSYVCERLTQNLCNNQKSRAIVTQQGSFFWEKLTGGSAGVCFDPSKNASCEIVRPGCQGAWPNCFNCTRHCRDDLVRYGYSGNRNSTFWPDGDADSSLPVFGLCNHQDTFIFNRVLDLSTGTVVLDYRMSSFDLFRLTRLRTYTQLGFWFGNATADHYSIYLNPFVDANGTLQNITFGYSYPSGGNIFKLNGQNLKSAPFVFVSDDRYGCGSFWLRDPANATYCPGGDVSIFGTPQIQRNPFKVLSTGIRWPTFTAGTILKYGSVSLL